MYLDEDGITTTWYDFEHVSTHMLKSRSSTPQKPLMSSWQPFSFGWLYVAKKLYYTLNVLNLLMDHRGVGYITKLTEEKHCVSVKNCLEQ